MTIRPPAHVAPYIEVLGQELGIKFLLAFGGSYIYLSERPQERSDVAALIGAENTKRLAKRLGSGSFRAPNGKPYIAQVLKAQGQTTNAIARKLHVSDVSVRGWLKRPDDRQLTLL